MIQSNFCQTEIWAPFKVYGFITSSGETLKGLSLMTSLNYLTAHRHPGVLSVPDALAQAQASLKCNIFFIQVIRLKCNIFYHN